jgi:uncharacterized protein (TIGR02246 family)
MERAGGTYNALILNRLLRIDGCCAENKERLIFRDVSNPGKEESGMKKIWLALLAIAGISLGLGLRGNLRAQPSPREDADRAAITAVLSAQQRAWNDGNVDAFLEGYWHSPELTFSGSGGVARGWDGVMARYKKSYPDKAAMGQLDFSGLEFRFLGPDAALVLGKWHLTREKGDAGGVFSLVWQRFPEGWKIVHDHTSAFERKDAPHN